MDPRGHSLEVIRFRALVAYDGSRFHGWQAQPREATVQGELERALTAITRQKVRIQGAGRTDAGVHALGQAMNFEVATRLAPHRMEAALNAHLPPEIRVYACEEAPDGFSARFSATWRAYEYVLARDRSPFLAKYAHTPPRWPELEAMNRCAPALLGEHSFRAFTSQKDPPFGCHVHELHWSAWAGGLVFRIRADRFLYRMVRILVGTFLQIGAGQRPGSALTQVLQASDRTAAGPLAPGHALFLSAVGYRPGWPTWGEPGAIGKPQERAVRPVLGPADVGHWVIDDTHDAATLPARQRE